MSANVIWSEAVSGGTDASHLPTPVLDSETSQPELNVEEHDGTVLKGVDSEGNLGSGDPGAIMPFSIGKWIADAKGLVSGDARNGAVLGTVGGDLPYTGTADAPCDLNPNYVSDNAALTRPVYNVVPTAEAANPRSLVNWAFVGTGSLVCSQPAVIAEYGFQPLGSGCGDASSSHQAYNPAASTATVTLAKLSATKLNYGAKFTTSATVASNDNGG